MTSIKENKYKQNTYKFKDQLSADLCHDIRRRESSFLFCFWSFTKEEIIYFTWKNTHIQCGKKTKSNHPNTLGNWQMEFKTDGKERAFILSIWLKLNSSWTHFSTQYLHQKKTLRYEFLKRRKLFTKHLDTHLYLKMWLFL